MGCGIITIVICRNFYPLNRTTACINMSESAKPSEVNIPEIIAKVDDMHENNKMREAYEFLLPYKDIEDAEIQWRFARICYQVGKHYEPDKTKAEALAMEGLEHVDKGLEIDENMFACYKVS